MSERGEMAERHSRILAELSEAGLMAVRNLQDRMQATEDPKVAADLALALHRISRSVRQTMALEAKLERDRHRDLAEEAARAATQDQAARKHRKAQVDAALDRLVWTEAERDEDFDAHSLLVERRHILDEESLSETFLDGPVEALIARIREELGLADNSTPNPPSSLAAEGVRRTPDG